MFLVWDSGHHSREHPVMPLSSRYSIPGFSNQDSPYLLHVDSVASSFRLLVTFALVLEVRGISFFQIPWTTYGSSSLSNRKITTKVLLTSSRFYAATLPVLPFCMGYPEEIWWALLDILIYASMTQKSICSFELSLFSCIPTPVYQLIVRSSCASCSSMPIILVVRQAILSQND